MLSHKNQIALTKLLRDKEIIKLKAEIRQKDEIIKQLKGLIKKIPNNFTNEEAE